MKLIPRYDLLIILFICSGCAWFGSQEANPDIEPSAMQLEKLEKTRFVEAGRIVNKARLHEGGKLLIKPFSAGPNVEVNDELDRVSLRIIRGVLDIYEGKALPQELKDEFKADRFDIALTEEEQDAELILRGHVTELSSPSGWKKWMGMKPKIRLSVEGRLVDSRSNVTVLLFKDSIEAEKAKGDFGQLGQEIGQHIGKYIFYTEKKENGYQ
ncbi:MAG TPA: hypothetical protein VI749_03770 [Candidatus Omnitrophota bacterium]|nr:hypothetical protein [Candidatus Omnitrophota bacterium]